jgi:2-polyprenyl-3-methyl-5-hydroxy-6-metoxy-1,4-benzoquinol methylase
VPANDDSAARDGSPVELYRLLPPRGEPEMIHALVAPGAQILELGCGVGRITHPLVDLGHPVVGVDESAEMLAHVLGAETVCARIEELDLGRRFPVVLLMSNLVNTPRDQRGKFLRTCRRHVTDDGIVLVERLEPDWTPLEGAESRIGRVKVVLRELDREGTVVSGVVEYAAGGRTWRHAFESRLLDDAVLEVSLLEAGLELSRVLDDARRWVEARPTG